MAVLAFVGIVVAGRFIPPFVDPSDGARVVAERYAEHGGRIRVGAVLTAISLSLIAPFGAVIAARTRPTEGGRPLLAYVQVACVAVAVVLVVLAATVWALTAFRPGEYPDELVRYSNDLAYFLFIFTWPPFTVWFAAIAIAVLGGDQPDPPLPRWIGYLSWWLAILIAAGSVIAFVKTGPFAYNGLLALYVPVVSFFVWVMAMTYALWKGRSA